MACLLALPALGWTQSVADDDAYGRLLAKYVRADGVDYAQWHATPADVDALDRVLESWSRIDLETMPEADLKAFYINLYNAAMIQVVLDQYPIESVTKIGLIPFSVFKSDFIRLGKDKYSLDDIEKGILLKQFPDPRIHFAVNCASISCPPLAAAPYTGGELDAQLKAATIAFANSAHAARIDTEDESTAYSKLFKWYADDFGTENPAEYLNRYREQSLPLDHAVQWIDYDWGLNAAD